MRMKKARALEEKRRPVWVDWLILALILLVILTAAHYVMQRRRAVVPTVSVSYTVLLSGVDVSFVSDGDWTELIPIGSAVTSQNGTAHLGNVTSVSQRTHLQATVRDGGVVFAEMPALADLTVTVRAEATEKEGDGLRVSDIRIAAGETGDFRLGSFLASGAKVISVERRAAE